MRTKKLKRNQLAIWLEGARLRTLPLAIAPVAIGAGVADGMQAFDLTLSLLALAVALFLQIAVNFANDYSDGIRGTDDNRVGPLRLTASNSVKPVQVKYAAFGFFALAALAGLAIVFLTSLWWLVGLGAAAIIAAWFYTGGKNPYGYAGFGEVAVFVFFGLVATIGTAFIQIRTFEGNSLLGGIAAGLFASAVLMVNNIRDIDTDRVAGKRTLAVRVGKRKATYIFIAMIWLPMVLLWPFTLLYPATVLGYLVVLILAPITLIVLTAKSAKELILVLKLTSLAALAYALLLALGLFTVFF
ncbi:MAG: 1,4-dihydroxy-2-naphthoate polyprenyltransferase [Actinomycetota bacterium]